jgi:hypothetical protein
MANYEHVIEKDKRRKKEKKSVSKCIDTIEDYIEPDSLILLFGNKMIKIQNPTKKMVRTAKKMKREGKAKKVTGLFLKDQRGDD